MKTILFLLLATLLLGPAAALGAQEPIADPPAPAGSDAVETQPTAQPPAYAAEIRPEPVQTATQTAAPPRTLRAFWHLFVAFATTLVLIFGYALSIGARLARVERRLAALGAPQER